MTIEQLLNPTESYELLFHDFLSLLQILESELNVQLADIFLKGPWISHVIQRWRRFGSYYCTKSAGRYRVQSDFLDSLELSDAYHCPVDDKLEFDEQVVFVMQRNIFPKLCLLFSQVGLYIEYLVESVFPECSNIFADGNVPPLPQWEVRLYRAIRLQFLYKVN